MESWESVTPRGAFGRFIDEDERAAIAGTPLSIVAIREDFGHTYNGSPSPRWLMDAVHLETGELICPTFGSNPVRDRAFSAASKALDAGKELSPVVMLQTGKAKPGQSPYWVIRSATPDELAAAGFSEPLKVVETVRAAIETAKAGATEDRIASDDDELPF